MTSAPMTAHKRVLLASLIGTSVEFYDFYIYATAAALVFGPLFFPAEDQGAQLLLSYASFGLAFIARPVGAAIFGHFGDRIGRKSTLVASLMLMGGSTVAIAFLPTYAQIGWVAPLILCILRFGQGLGLGGEWGGASLLAVENAPPGWRNRYGMFPPLGAPVGFIAANGFFLILGATLTDVQFREWGWRLLLPRQRGAGRARAVGAAEADRDAGVPRGGEGGEAPQGTDRHAVPRSSAPDAGGDLRRGRVFRALLPRDRFALGYGTTTLGHNRQAFLAVELAAILFLALGVIVASVLAGSVQRPDDAALGLCRRRGGGAADGAVCSARRRSSSCSCGWPLRCS